MPNVLVLGATGYIGQPLCASLLRSGNYAVWGTARSAAKAAALLASEITPLIGDVSNPETYLPLVRSGPIDIIIDCSTAYASASTTLTALRSYSASRRAALAAEGFPASPKLAYLVISGTWVHGSPAGPVSDLHLPGTSLSKGAPASITGWRPAYEQAVLAARDELDVAIVRPACVHGRSSWLWDPLWAPIADAAEKPDTSARPLRIPLAPDAKPGVTHVDDIVSGVHAVADKLLTNTGLGSWPVFDLVTETISMRAILEAVAECVGCTRELEFVGSGEGEAEDKMMQAMGLRTTGSAERARIVLGWEPRRRDFLGEMRLFVNAWRAEREGVKGGSGSGSGSGAKELWAWARK